MLGEVLQTGMVGLEEIWGTEDHGENSGLSSRLRNYLRRKKVKQNISVHISELIIS